MNVKKNRYTKRRIHFFPKTTGDKCTTVEVWMWCATNARNCSKLILIYAMLLPTSNDRTFFVTVIWLDTLPVTESRILLHTLGGMNCYRVPLTYRCDFLWNAHFKYMVIKCICYKGFLFIMLIKSCNNMFCVSYQFCIMPTSKWKDIAIHQV